MCKRRLAPTAPCALCLLAAFVLVLVGCGDNGSQTSSGQGEGADPHGEHAQHDDDHEGHDHGHDEPAADEHDHASHSMGPHGGHMLHLNPGGAHAEWVHLDEKNELQVFLEDSLLPVDSVEMHVQIGGQEQAPYLLESAEEELGKGAYRLTDDALMTHVKMSAGEGVDVELVVARGAESLTAAIQHHEH